MLAEVSDRIPPVGVFWCLHLLVAAMVLALSHLSQRRAVLVLLLPLTIAWTAFFAQDALVAEDPMRDDVRQEMGAGYFIHQAVAACCPLAR
jgi:hypothetical protein